MIVRNEKTKSSDADVREALERIVDKVCGPHYEEDGDYLTIVQHILMEYDMIKHDYGYDTPTKSPKPTVKDIVAQAKVWHCQLCKRPGRASKHHMIPRSRGGKATEKICTDCHDAAHAMFSNRELEREYNSIELLMGNVEFAKQVAFIAKQDVGGKVKVKRSNKRSKRP